MQIAGTRERLPSAEHQRNPHTQISLLEDSRCSSLHWGSPLRRRRRCAYLRTRYSLFLLPPSPILNILRAFYFFCGSTLRYKASLPQQTLCLLFLPIPRSSDARAHDGLLATCSEAIGIVGAGHLVATPRSSWASGCMNWCGWIRWMRWIA